MPMLSDNPIARLTGLTLDPETPMQQQQQQDETTGNDAAAKINKDEAGVDADHDASLDADVDADVDGGDQNGGKNVAEVRAETGVKAGVSKVIQGVHERVLSITGSTFNVAKAYSMMAHYLLENPVSNQSNAYSDCTTIRLLISHQLVGSVIGKAGAKIKEIQEESGAKLIISKEMLPQSTERVIEVFGLVESIKIAIYNIAECVINDLERAVGTILYNPQVRLHNNSDYRGHGSIPRTGRFDETPSPRGGESSSGYRGSNPNRRSDGGPYTGGRRFPINPSPSNRDHNDSKYNGERAPSAGGNRDRDNVPAGDLQTQTFAVPIDMVGCIIGKGGSFINTIRRQSSARLRIAEPENGSSERVVTIVGTAAANAKALQMIHDQLESEKMRRLNGDANAEE
ncbi:RNA binding protein, heterogenous nuclear RNP-K like protein [Blyttiomyces sp. JEL0837]|nr:RNA binding protein, heterogenous nuclear RNP-K like protein [Blyttiomyces sp. JEL0837]